MRILAILLLLISTPAFSETIINAILEKGHHFSAPYRGEIADTKKFPSKNYRVHTEKFNLADSSDTYFNPKEYQGIFFDITLDLIDYDKFQDLYTFKLTLEPGIACASPGSGPYKSIKTAKIYFTENGQDSIITQSKFNRIFYDDRKDNLYNYKKPKINELDAQPFVLTIVTLNPKSQQLNIGDLEKFIISTQHNIPVTIKFD